MTVNKTLEERGNNYGKFRTQAALSQQLKNTMRNTAKWEELEPFQQEALEMIQHKAARLLNGNPLYLDTIRDIIGYAQLLYDELSTIEGATDAKIQMVVRDNGQWRDKIAL